jgi:hypothetical protein
MTLRDHLRTEVFGRLLRDPQSRGCLVVYDPERRYRDIALDLADEQGRVIDASGSVIESREAATEALYDLGAGESSPRSRRRSGGRRLALKKPMKTNPN